MPSTGTLRTVVSLVVSCPVALLSLRRPLGLRIIIIRRAMRRQTRLTGPGIKFWLRRYCPEVLILVDGVPLPVDGNAVQQMGAQPGYSVTRRYDTSSTPYSMNQSKGGQTFSEVILYHNGRLRSVRNQCVHRRGHSLPEGCDGSTLVEADAMGVHWLKQ